MRQLKNYKSEESTAADIPSADKYAGMNESELMAELMKSIAAAKQDGTFSIDELEAFAAFAAPSLDEKAQARLKGIIEAIKSGKDDLT